MVVDATLFHFQWTKFKHFWLHYFHKTVQWHEIYNLTRTNSFGYIFFHSSFSLSYIHNFGKIQNICLLLFLFSLYSVYTEHTKPLIIWQADCILLLLLVYLFAWRASALTLSHTCMWKKNHLLFWPHFILSHIFFCSNSFGDLIYFNLFMYKTMSNKNKYKMSKQKVERV